MVHHSLTKDSGTVSWAAIEKHHRVTQGWREIGYHAGIELVTESADLRDYRYQALLGRPEREIAAACKEGRMNELALHVCCVGDYDTTAPPLAMLQRLCGRVLLPWMSRYGIGPDNIVAHRDFAKYKSCPGLKFDMDALRRMVR